LDFFLQPGQWPDGALAQQNYPRWNYTHALEYADP